MSKKISEMTPTGEAPATSEFMFAYNGDNYSIEKDNLISGSNDYISILDSAGNDVAILTGISGSSDITDPIQIKGTNDVSFFVCGCSPTQPPAPPTPPNPLQVHSYAVPALWDEVEVDSFFPFRHSDNEIDYMIHADPLANCSNTDGQPIPNVLTLVAGTWTYGVNYTEQTHGITDANMIDYYAQPNKKNYIVTHTSAGTLNVYQCRLFANEGYKDYVKNSFTVLEYTGFLLGGTRWLMSDGPDDWNGKYIDFYYGYGHIGDHSTNGRARLADGSGYAWTWDKDNGNLNISLSSSVNVNGVTLTDVCPISTSVSMAGTHNFTITRMT